MFLLVPTLLGGNMDKNRYIRFTIPTHGTLITSLYFSSSHDIIQLLLEKGMGPHVKDGNLQTPTFTLRGEV